MIDTADIIKIDKNSFRANVYSNKYFRMIGLIDVIIQYEDFIERVTLGYYSSSGTNNGKVKGLWYPIIGIKLFSGPFIEYTPRLNAILTYTTESGRASNGWLAKSLFFYKSPKASDKLRGFGSGRYYEQLLNVGQELKKLYEMSSYRLIPELDGKLFNKLLMSNKVYYGNAYSQLQNYERFIECIFYED